eukprot:evm.model.scf_344.1 EVM.evm.TU.scf_344.1   scf_344:21465-22043(-)
MLAALPAESLAGAVAKRRRSADQLPPLACPAKDPARDSQRDPARSCADGSGEGGDCGDAARKRRGGLSRFYATKAQSFDRLSDALDSEWGESAMGLAKRVKMSNPCADGGGGEGEIGRGMQWLKERTEEACALLEGLNFGSQGGGGGGGGHVGLSVRITEARGVPCVEGGKRGQEADLDDAGLAGRRRVLAG